MNKSKIKTLQSCFIFTLLLCICALSIAISTGALYVNLKQLNVIPLWIFAIILYAILLFGLKLAKPGTFHEDALSLPVSKGILGFCALGIVMHHLIQQLTHYHLAGVQYFNDIGVLFVAVFFFFSGYGLYVSMSTKANYMKHFLRKRFPTILIPYFLISWLFILVRYLAGETISPGRLLLLITTIRMPNTQAWYIVETILLYLVFFLSFRFIKNKNVAYALNGIAAVLLIAIGLLRGHSLYGDEWFKGEWWYNTTLLFFCGMSYAKFRPVLLPKIKKFYWLLLPLSIAFFGVLFHLTKVVSEQAGYWSETALSMHYGDKLLTLAVQFPMILCFVIAFLLLTLKVQFGNRFLRFLGTFTLELYLVQNLFVYYIGHAGLLEFGPLYVLISYAGTILVAYGIHKLDHQLLNKIRK